MNLAMRSLTQMMRMRLPRGVTFSRWSSGAPAHTQAFSTFTVQCLLDHMGPGMKTECSFVPMTTLQRSLGVQLQSSCKSCGNWKVSTAFCPLVLSKIFSIYLFLIDTLEDFDFFPKFMKLYMASN